MEQLDKNSKRSCQQKRINISLGKLKKTKKSWFKGKKEVSLHNYKEQNDETKIDTYRIKIKYTNYDRQLSACVLVTCWR